MSQHNHSKRSLSVEVEKQLNDQIVMEGKSSASYLSMASWCETEGYANASNFLYTHSDEERGHMLKLFSYINQAGGHALQPEITNIKHKFSSLREVFEDVLEHEIRVTKSIHEIVDHCLGTKDFSTFSYLQWFVTEQREEESLARRILEIFNIIGEDGVGLWTIDQEIGKIITTGPAGNTAG
jgi:ferritin